MPNYKVYVEPFLGSGSIFYNVPFKDDAKYIINDLDEYIYRIHNSFKLGYSYIEPEMDILPGCTWYSRYVKVSGIIDFE